MKPVSELLVTLGLSVPADLHLFEQALTHRSAMGLPDYERLEYLGDAVLKLAISQLLYSGYPHFAEGELTKIRARVVSDQVLAQLANSLDWALYLRLGATERATRGGTKTGTLASSLEAFLGALYLQEGIASVLDLVARIFAPYLEEAALNPGAENAKAILQELTQGMGQGLPVYVVVNEEGPQHDRVFEIQVSVGGQVLGKGRGVSKKAAEQAAAGQALVKLKAASRSLSAGHP